MLERRGFLGTLLLGAAAGVLLGCDRKATPTPTLASNEPIDAEYKGCAG